MKRALIFILLLVHLNFSVFIPQFEEVDRVDAKGKPVDDINSLTEFVYEIVLGNKDTTPEDEDNDHARDVHVIKMANYCARHQFTKLTHTRSELAEVPTHVTHQDQKLAPVFFDIPSPPPKA